MTTKSTTVTEDKEEIVDDVSNEEVTTPEEQLDQDKLAALKAKLKAQEPEEKGEDVPAKIVEEKTRSIRLGIIGSGQAGCVAGTTNIYVSELGIIPIQDLFYKYLSSANFEDIQVTGDKQTCISLQDKNIYTVSIDPNSGALKKARVTAVWKNRAYSKNKITTNNGASLICSKKHPSLVFRPKSRRKAFFQSLNNSNPLSVGDRLVDSRLDVLDLLSEKTYVRDIEVTPDIAWLLGVFAGDGHNKLSGNEISIYSDNDFLTRKIVEIANKIPHTSIKCNEQPGCKQIAIYGMQARLFFESAFEHNITKTYGGFGEKTYMIDIPTCVTAASSAIRTAFLAGVIDSDGTVYDQWCEASIFTCSSVLADKLGCLISSIGGRSALEVIQPRRDNEQLGYRLRLSGKLNFGPLMTDLIKNISHTVKRERLIYWAQRDQKSFATSSVPLSFDEVSFWLQREGGMTTVNNLCTKSGVSAKAWSRGERCLSVSSFDKMIDSLNSSEQLNYVKDIAPKLLPIKSIDIVDDSECEFFDLTVDEYENYVAGNNGFVFTHNSRVAETFYKHGYPAVAVNTASQDLEHIEMPEANKLLLDYGLGGAGKELDIGHAAAEAYRDSINELVHKKLNDAQLLLFCTSLGGGSGAGSAEVIVDILAGMERPIGVITVLPMSTDDAQTKHNAIQTLSKFTKLAQKRVIDNLIVVDNAKIETIYRDVGPLNFFNVSNEAIVDPIDQFNTLSAQASSVKGLDPTEFGKLFTDGQGLTIYGTMTVPNFTEDTAIAEAVVDNLSGSLLAAGFNLKQTRYAGAIFVANKRVWDQIPNSSVNFAMSMINDVCGTPLGSFRGIYTVDMDEDVVKVYSMFSGLQLPAERIEQLQAEAKTLTQRNKEKDVHRLEGLKLDGGIEETISEADKVKERIQAKKSAFGKLHGRAVIDRRKK